MCEELLGTQRGEEHLVENVSDMFTITEMYIVLSLTCKERSMILGFCAGLDLGNLVVREVCCHLNILTNGSTNSRPRPIPLQPSLYSS